MLLTLDQPVDDSRLWCGGSSRKRNSTEEQMRIVALTMRTEGKCQLNSIQGPCPQLYVIKVTATVAATFPRRWHA